MSSFFILNPTQPLTFSQFQLNPPKHSNLFKKCLRYPLNPFSLPTQIDSVCFQSSTHKSGRCTRRPKHRSGLPRRSIYHKTNDTGTKL
ncbi:hypothetical protein CsSME_00007141 [Camellia sinensis var. sinensis]